MINALVVDDNRDVVDAICGMLGLMGLSAEAAYGARACLLAIKDHIPDVIFMDINMPAIDGFEVISFLSREPGLAQVPVVVVTAEVGVEIETRARQLGAAAFIQKPATFEALHAGLAAAGFKISV
jgi:CheY-like chemotaxis protein